jgi:MFS family permease
MVPSPSLAHFAAVALVLGVGHASFQPALMSALPALVGGERLVTANAVVTGTFHVAIMVGPMVGAALVATVGGWGAFAVNAASFVVSAALLIRIPLPSPMPDEREPWSPVGDLLEGARFVARSRVARGVLVAMGLTLFLVAAQKPLELGLIRQILAPHGDAGVRAAILGAFTTAFGIGMVAGSALAPSIARRCSRQRMLAASIGVVGLTFLGAAAFPHAATVVALWVVAGTAAGVMNVSYETLLQEHTPDALLGRTFAAVEAAQEGTYFVGAVVVGAIGGLVPPTLGMAVVGTGFVGVALVAGRVLRSGAIEVSLVTHPPATAGMTVVPVER